MKNSPPPSWHHFQKTTSKVLEVGWGYIPSHLLLALVSRLNLLLSVMSKQGPEHSFSVSASLPSTSSLYSSNHHSAQQTILFGASAPMLGEIWVQHVASMTPCFKRSESFFLLYCCQQILLPVRRCIFVYFAFGNTIVGFWVFGNLLKWLIYHLTQLTLWHDVNENPPRRCRRQSQLCLPCV